MIKAIIFDLDGTLVNLPLNYAKLREKLGIDSEESLLETVKGLSESGKTKFFTFWTDQEADAMKGLKAISKGMWLYYHYLDFKRGLVTLQSLEAVVDICEKLDLSFDSIVTRDYSLDRDVQLICSIVTLGVKAENALFIGNRDSDYESAKKVGCNFLKVV